MKLQLLFDEESTQKKNIDQDGSDDHLQRELGTYSALEVDKDSADAIQRFSVDYNIKNFVDIDSLHCTILYSTKFLPDFHATGSLQRPFVGHKLYLEVWDTQAGSKALVMRFTAPEIEEYHRSLMDRHDAEYPYDEFKPHVTLSYDIEDNEYNLAEMSYKLSRYLDHIVFDFEYEEPLNIKKRDGDEE